MPLTSCDELSLATKQMDYQESFADKMIKVGLNVPILLLFEALQNCCLKLPWQGLLQDLLPRRKQLPSSSPLGRINTTDLESS